MNAVKHKHCNHVIGAPIGWDQDKLPVDALPVNVAMEDGVCLLQSFWRPTPEEIEAISHGHCVLLTILSNQHPIVSVGVAHET